VRLNVANGTFRQAGHLPGGILIHRPADGDFVKLLFFGESP